MYRSCWHGVEGHARLAHRGVDGHVVGGGLFELKSPRPSEGRRALVEKKAGGS